MKDDMCEEIAIKINWRHGTYYDGSIWKFKDANLPLNGKYEDGGGTIRYFKQGKYHNENGPVYIGKDGYKEYGINGKRHRIDGPAVIHSNGDCRWFINNCFIEKETIDNWLIENDIPLVWNTWSDSDKMLFALYWSDYNG